MTSVDSNLNFLCGRPHGLDPSLIHMRPTETDPLHVDVTNGWPLSWSSFRMLATCDQFFFVMSLSLLPSVFISPPIYRNFSTSSIFSPWMLILKRCLFSLFND